MKLHTKLLILFSLATFTLYSQNKPVAPANAAKPAAIKSSRPAAAVNSGGALASDAQIQQTIDAKLAKSKIGADGFKVRVQGGVATWEGKTGVIQHKGAATRMARTSGAKTVVNNIQISDAARAKASGNFGKARVAKVKAS